MRSSWVRMRTGNNGVSAARQAERNEGPMIKDEYRALVLRLLAQILLKLQVGPQWGLNEAGVTKLTIDAESLAKAIERGEGG